MISGPCQGSFKAAKQSRDPAPDRDQLPTLESQSAPDRASVEIKNKAQMPQHSFYSLCLASSCDKKIIKCFVSCVQANRAIHTIWSFSALTHVPTPHPCMYRPKGKFPEASSYLGKIEHRLRKPQKGRWERQVNRNLIGAQS